MIGKSSKELFESYRTDESGVFAVKFAIGSAVLMIGMSIAISINQLVSEKAKLQAAADSAVLAAATKIDIPIAERKKIGSLVFDQNAMELGVVVSRSKLVVTGTLPTEQNPTSTVNAKIEVSAEVNSFFSFAIPELSKLSVSAEAVVGFAPREEPPHIDLHIIFDNSASMGIGQTKGDRDAMVYDTEIEGSLGMEPCAFACHSPTENSYDFYKNKGVRLRIDALSDALTGFVEKAADEVTASTKNTRINIVPLDQMTNPGGYNFSTSLDAAKTEAQNVSLTSGDGFTDLQTPLSKINELVENVGNGSSAAEPIVYVILMTDGLEHFEDPTPSGNSLPSLSSMSQADPTIGGTFMQTLEEEHCGTLKDRGIKLIVMNVEYGFPDLIWDWPVKNWQDIGYQPDLDQLKIVNDFLPEIPFTLRRCASTPMDYYQVEQENEMIDAFDEIFQELESKNDELIVSRLSR